jgi:hypothetical protein
MRVRASGSFRRYAIDPRAVDGGVKRLREEPASLAKKLHGQRFRSIDHAGSEVSSVGWSRSDGTVPREFDGEEAWLADVMAVALRIDRKRLPPGALRVRRMEAEAAERRNVGERIAPARRREIADKIEAELVARVVPATALHAMLWSSTRGELLLNTTADPANVAFRALFRETFGGSLEPLVTATLAERLAPGRKLPELAPALFIEGGVAIVTDSAAFLGRELLLWLWHQCETTGGKFELAELGEVGVAFDQLIELGGASEGGRVSVRGDAATRAPEAASALLGGKLPLKARLVLARGDKTFEVTLAADTLDLDGVKVAADEQEISDENLRAGDEQRAAWLFELASIVDALFADFLKLRVARDYDDVVRSIRNWIVTRGRARVRTAASG